MNLQDQAGWLRGGLKSCSSGRGHTMGLALRLAAIPSSPSTQPEPWSLCPFGKFKAIFKAFKFSAKGLAQSRTSPARDSSIPESCSCWFVLGCNLWCWMCDQMPGLAQETGISSSCSSAASGSWNLLSGLWSRGHKPWLLL